MKKNHLKVMAVAALVSSTFALESCRKDDPAPSQPTLTGIAANFNDFKGEVKAGEKVTLDPTKVYKLTGGVHVKEGGELIIPAGTKIESTAGTAAYITVEQGGKIFANGTSSSPVVFTSPTGTAGSWGGIVICGRAPINKGTTANAEVGNATYGGTNAADNSGSLTYVRIEHSGAIFTGEKEFNGLSLFGVGNGTKIENISILNGADDGIEFFGGTVNVSNIISVGNEDDAFDWTEGWKGTATNIYTKRRANGIGNRGIEADNNADNNNAEPRSNPTIKNGTFIGDPAFSGEADGFKLRVGTYATIDNVVLSNWKTGINIEHDASVAYFNGSGKITNVKFDNVTTKASVKASSGSPSATLQDNTYVENANANGAGNGLAVPTWAGTWGGL